MADRSTTPGPIPAAPHGVAVVEHAHHHPRLQHHFYSMEQQLEASILAMWVFLVTEIMFFGGLFMAYIVYRTMYPQAWLDGSAALNVPLGAANTAVLICSSLTMVLAVRSAQVGSRRGQIGSGAHHREDPTVTDTVYTLPDLPYDPGALEPHISARIMALHHDKHHAAYVKGANTALDKLSDIREKGDFSTIAMLEKNLAFHVSGHVLHSLFWRSMGPDGSERRPGGDLQQAIGRDFGSFDRFRRQMNEVAACIMGSGWAALVWEPLSSRLLVAQRASGLRGRSARRAEHPAPGSVPDLRTHPARR